MARKKDKKKEKKGGGDKDLVASALLGSLKSRGQAGAGTAAGGTSSLLEKLMAGSTSALASAPGIGSKKRRGAHKTTLGVQERLQRAELDTRPWVEILADEAHWIPLPFTHGLEIELLIVDDQGNYLKGEDMVHRMTEMVKDATEIMTQVIARERTDFYPNGMFHYLPRFIHSKLGANPFTKNDVEKGLCMDIRYRVGEGFVDVDCFGRDGNVAAITYILELVTPPCEYVEEMAYWASTLFSLAKTTLPRDLHIMATALNPRTVEYQRGLSQGLHSHIGTFKSELEKAQVYDMLRNFLPHMIALSVNSPIIRNAPTDVIKVRDGRITSPNCVRSLRLKFNTTMLSSSDPNHFLPYLTSLDQQAQQHFLATVQKASMEDARFQDVFPFTDWGTIELRVMDTQISICRTIGLAMLVQLLAYKARKIVEAGRLVPDPGPHMIVANRTQAIERGLIGIYRTADERVDPIAEVDPEFAACYFGSPERPVRYLFDAVKNMFYYLRREMKELGFVYSPFFKPILQSVFGDIDYAKPPITEAEYQLSVYSFKLQQGETQPDLVNDLIYFTVEYSKDPLSHPLIGQLNLPPDLIK
ncbi:MAG: hypothetical protein Kow0069_27680 [Promethearchaeota archaeon]